MSDEGRPLPQRERGATEAGAGPAANPAGPRALTDDLRQRMQASVEAERAQARERVTEMLRRPPQRRPSTVSTASAGPAAADPQDVPGQAGPDRKPHGKRKRSPHSKPSEQPGRRARFERGPRADRPASPGAPATSGPNVIVPGVHGVTTDDAGPTETVSPMGAETGGAGP